jgi:K+-sensing histidine kinase KdpD
MPPVVTDPTMLDQVLTGALENFISSVPGGSDVQVKVMLAGHQLKMQLHSEIKADQWDPSSATTPPLKSIGQLLMFQPETGNISLNLSTTKNLFQALGAKLIVRKRSHQGQVLTIFLPLEA